MQYLPHLLVDAEEDEAHSLRLLLKQPIRRKLNQQRFLYC